MPMGIVSDDELEKEIKDSGTIKPEFMNEAIIKEINRPGRHEGDNNVPDSLRKIIGETDIVEGRTEAIELAREFGISASSVSAYSNGSTSTKSYNQQPNLTHLNSIRERITKKARRTLIKSIDSITDEKLTDAKPEILAGIARSMSAIVKEMEPEPPKNGEDKQGPTFVFFSPTFKKEEHFEHVFVKDNDK